MKSSAGIISIVVRGGAVAPRLELAPDNLPSRQVRPAVVLNRMCDRATVAPCCVWQPVPAARLKSSVGTGGLPHLAGEMFKTMAVSERLGQSFVIENRSGATGIIATEAVVGIRR